MCVRSCVRVSLDTYTHIYFGDPKLLTMENSIFGFVVHPKKACFICGTMGRMREEGSGGGSRMSIFLVGHCKHSCLKASKTFILCVALNLMTLVVLCIHVFSLTIHTHRHCLPLPSLTKKLYRKM